MYDIANNRYFISNNGSNQILARDSSGALSIFTSAIGSGPHGLEIVGNTLFACDGSFMKGFDLTSGVQVMSLNVGATFLNGICSDGNNYIYATDFSAKKIFKINIAAQTFTQFVTGLAKSPNGIYYDAANQKLIWVTWGSGAPVMQAILADSSVSQITATTLGNCDGLVRDVNGNYYVSAWSTQSVHRFDSLFSTAPLAVITGLNNPADIYYNLADDSLVSPNTGSNSVTFHYMGIVTSLAEIEAGSFSMYPNPVSKILTIEQANAKINRVEIYDANGKNIFNRGQTVNDYSALSIDVSFLQTGIYFIRTNNGLMKFIKE